MTRLDIKSSTFIATHLTCHAKNVTCTWVLDSTTLHYSVQTVTSSNAAQLGARKILGTFHPSFPRSLAPNDTPSVRRRNQYPSRILRSKTLPRWLREILRLLNCKHLLEQASACRTPVKTTISISSVPSGFPPWTRLNHISLSLSLHLANDFHYSSSSPRSSGPDGHLPSFLPAYRHGDRC